MISASFYRLSAKDQARYIARMQSHLERVNFDWLKATAAHNEREARIADLEARELKSNIHYLETIAR